MNEVIKIDHPVVDWNPLSKFENSELSGLLAQIPDDISVYFTLNPLEDEVSCIMLELKENPNMVAFLSFEDFKTSIYLTGEGEFNLVNSNDHQRLHDTILKVQEFVVSSTEEYRKYLKRKNSSMKSV